MLFMHAEGYTEKGRNSKETLLSIQANEANFVLLLSIMHTKIDVFFCNCRLQMQFLIPFCIFQICNETKYTL